MQGSTDVLAPVAVALLVPVDVTTPVRTAPTSAALRIPAFPTSPPDLKLTGPIRRHRGGNPVAPAADLFTPQPATNGSSDEGRPARLTQEATQLLASLQAELGVDI